MVQNCHTGEQEMYWDNKNKENCNFKWYQFFVRVVPVRPLLSSILRQTDSRLRKRDISGRHHWLPCEKTFKERPQTTHQYPELSSASDWFKQISHPSWPVVSGWRCVISMEFLWVVYQSRLNYQPLFVKWAHAPPLNRRLDAWVCCCQLPPIRPRLLERWLI